VACGCPLLEMPGSNNNRRQRGGRRLSVECWKGVVKGKGGAGQHSITCTHISSICCLVTRGSRFSKIKVSVGVLESLIPFLGDATLDALM
jgi:hypothetical protein